LHPLDWLTSSKVFGYAVAALVGVVVTELTRRIARKRVVVETAQLPGFAVSLKEGVLSFRLSGKYSILNLSHLPINIVLFNVMVYNAASRAFQCNIGKLNVPFGEWFKEVLVPPDVEAALLSQENSGLTIERFHTRGIPSFIWFETLEEIRIGSRRRFRNRARLYWMCYWFEERGEGFYIPSWLDVDATLARIFALPGKWLYYRKTRRSAHISV
jgi:hypothetical protein